MPRFIAFLRAINVGGHTVKMDYLRQRFAALAFSNVETFIASGNVIFETEADDTQALEMQIEAELRQSLGYEVATFLRTPAQLAQIAAHQPFPHAEIEAEGHTLYIAFLAAPPTDAAQQKLLTFQNSVDSFHCHGREVYWSNRKRLGLSRFSGALLEKTFGQPATLRNVTTVKKLAALYPK